MNKHDATESAYNNGYEKGKADSAREIFEEINKIKKQYADGDIDGNTLYVYLYTIEKKYTEGMVNKND
jgi:hypothetical protein